MLDTLATGFALFFHVENFIVISVGVLIGLVVGAIPGLSAVMGVALALPFTFHMAPVTAILLLVGIYKGGVLGGSISAILIRTPGTPAAACTVLDGYPMAQRGEAGKALMAALNASCIADVISNLSLILFAGALASVALSFGPPEYVWLIAFSLTIVVAISPDSLVNGLIAGFLGMLVSTIGLDLVYGTQRLTFGSMDLMAGVSFVPMLVGLFAIPEIITHYRERSAPPRPTSRDSSRMTLAELKRCGKTIVRSSLIGVIVGAIPGAGATAAAFLSYGIAQRLSPNRKKFGTGEIEGVCAAEAGNNGVAGATLIPLLALGIPGDVVTAVILGAFTIHNLTPGPLLFEKNLDIVYAIFFGIILSSIVLFFGGRLVMRSFAGIARIPGQVLMPLIFLFCVFGSYASGNSLYGVGTMLAFGLVGYLMQLARLPIAPFLLGFILFPMFEDNFRRSLLISDEWTVFFRSPICWIFIALFLGSLFWGLKREAGETPSVAPQGTAE